MKMARQITLLFLVFLAPPAVYPQTSEQVNLNQEEIAKHTVLNNAA